MDELIEFAMGIHRGDCNDSFNGLCTCGIRLKAVKARDELKELRNQLEISNQQLKLGELLNNDLQKEVDRLNEQLEEKQKIIDEQLEIIKFYADTENYATLDTNRFTGNEVYDVLLFDFTRDLQKGHDYAGKKAREYLQKMESEK